MTDLPNGSVGTPRSETVARALRHLADWFGEQLRFERPAPPLSARARAARRREQDQVVSPLEEFH